MIADVQTTTAWAASEIIAAARLMRSLKGAGYKPLVEPDADGVRVRLEGPVGGDRLVGLGRLADVLGLSMEVGGDGVLFRLR
jgi:hypothetical protein